MGTLTYDSKIILNFDDRVLAHLQVVIWSKLRRREPFAFTVVVPAGQGSGRTSMWMSSNVSVTFQYYSTARQTLNTLWIDALITSANSPTGLQLVDEPEDRH